MQSHDNSSQQLDARHRAVPAEGANVDRGLIDTAVDVVAERIRARLSWFNLLQPRGKFQFKSSLCARLHVPDESPVKAR